VFHRTVFAWSIKLEHSAADLPIGCQGA
jgi:hypothetical protein